MCLKSAPAQPKDLSPHLASAAHQGFFLELGFPQVSVIDEEPDSGDARHLAEATVLSSQHKTS